MQPADSSSSHSPPTQVIQQALHRQPSTAAQYLQQMYAAQQQHLMLQTAALQQQHLSSAQLQSLAAVQQVRRLAAGLRLMGVQEEEAGTAPCFPGIPRQSSQSPSEGYCHHSLLADERAQLVSGTGILTGCPRKKCWESHLLNHIPVLLGKGP